MTKGKDMQGTAQLNKLSIALKESDLDTSIAAAKALGEIGEPAIPILVNSFTFIIPWEKEVAIRRALVSIGEPAVEQLVSALANDNAGLAAHFVLVNIGEPAVEPLIAALQCNDENTLFHAARALGKIGDIRAIEPLIKLHKDASGRASNAAGMALGQLGDPHAIPTLVSELQYQNFKVEVMQSLVKIGSAAVEPLIVALRDKGDTYTSEIDNLITVLGMIGDARAADILKAHATQGKDARLKNLALEALSKMNIQVDISEDEIGNLRDSLLNDDYDVRKAALIQARLVSSSIEDPAFQLALRASEMVQKAYDNQHDALDSTEPMQACHEAIRLEPGFSAAYICLSYLHRQYAKTLNDALIWVKKAIEIAPKNLEAWTELGMVHVALGDVVEAARAFHKVVTINPQYSNTEAYSRLVAVYRELGEVELLGEALERLNKAGMGLDPDREREWERMVLATNPDQLERAIMG